MKLCPKCGVTKDEELFSKDSSRPDGLQSLCKSCKTALSAQHYLNNKEHYIKSRNAFRKKTKCAYYKLKKAPCKDCQKSFSYYIMHFDHVKGVKIASVSECLRNKGLAAALEEIDKCDLICCNCHHNRTYQRCVTKSPYTDARFDFVRNLKVSAVCADCNIDHPYWILTFDHLRDKEFGINKACRSMSLSALKTEITKCDIVCGNCHAERTYGGMESVASMLDSMVA